MIRSVLPREVASSDATLVDVREYPEYAAASIEGSLLAPLAKVSSRAQEWSKNHPVVTICQSGKRATVAAQRLEALGFTNVSILDGGMNAWQQAGLPINIIRRKPWTLERQVRAIAGGMVVVSAVLGLTVSPWFFAWTLFVGAGLTFAGISNVCLMATLLGKMPWNRPPDARVECR